MAGRDYQKYGSQAQRTTGLNKILDRIQSRLEGLEKDTVTLRATRQKIRGNIFMDGFLDISGSTVSAPAITFGDTDSGIFSAADGQVSISADGAEVARFEDGQVGITGKVGVGVDAPLQALHLVGDGINAYIRQDRHVEDAVASQQLIYRSRGTVAALVDLGNGDDVFMSRWFARDDSSWKEMGRLEIGCSQADPADPLDSLIRFRGRQNNALVEQGRFQPDVFIVNNDGAADSSFRIYCGGISGSDYLQFTVNTAETIASYTASGTVALHHFVGGDVQIAQNLDVDVDLNVDGDAVIDGTLAIGIASPDGTLHVHSGSAGTWTGSGGLADDLIVENSAGGGITVAVPDTSSAKIHSVLVGDDFTAFWSHFKSSGDAFLDIGTQDGNGTLRLYSGNQSLAIRCYPDGEVGIMAGYLRLYNRTDANRGTPGAWEGQVIWNTDDNMPNFWNGSAWVDATGTAT